MNNLLLIAAATLLAAVSPTHAVMLSPDASGQVAIVPIYSTVGGVDTLLKVDSSSNSAVRIQFRSPAGDPLESFNVYLSGDSWGAAVTAGPDGPELVIPDTSCILGEGPAGVPTVIGSGIPVSEPYGYVEVLEMGVVRAEALVTAIHQRECDELITAFDSEVWAEDPNAGMDPPAGGLRVMSTLIDVERGTQFSTQPIHLRGFRDAPFHVSPAGFYGLVDARDAGTDSGATRSVICVDECVVEEWADPLDAVASVLMVNAMEADFVVNPEIGASTVGVLVNPLLPYYGSGHPSAAGVFGLLPKDSEFGLQTRPCIGTPPPGDICPLLGIGDLSAQQVFSVEVVDYQVGLPDLVPILAIPGAFPINRNFIEGNTPIDTLRSGAVMVEFFFRSPRWLTSNDGTVYVGHPSHMIMLSELVNDSIIDHEGDRIRANYGHASRATRIVVSEELEE